VDAATPRIGWQKGCMTDTSTFVSSDGDGYELQMGRWSRRLAPLLIEFAGIGGSVRVLDVGCGTGNLSSCLAQNPEIVRISGLDISQAYIEHAIHRNGDRRLDFQVGDACALPFRDASFDHSVSMLALQFVPGADLAVREMCRVTRPGGTVAAATWDSRGGLVAQRMILDAAAILDQHGREARAATYTRPLSRPGDLARLWISAGLTNVAQDMRTIRMDFSSFADFWMPVEGREGPVAEYVRTLGRKTKARLRDIVRLAYLDGEGDGPRSYAATAWVVKGSVP
jgi:SAM-dependent methyltransferase